MAEARPSRLDRPIDKAHDHVLGPADAPITLLEYGSYACPYCHAAHEIVARLRDRFGGRMRYVFRHLPIAGSAEAERAAILAEYADETAGAFWPVHDALMRRGPAFAAEDFARIAAEHDLPPREETEEPAWRAAERRVEADRLSARQSGAYGTPTFFVGSRRYEGAWDENALAEAMEGSLGHRLQTASLDFARWAPSTGLLLLVMALLAIALANSPAGPAFQALWHAPLGLGLGGRAFALPLLDWINHGLLTIFFLVIGLEVKREFTVGRLAHRRAAALPIVASFGGMAAPALIYLALAPPGPLSAGWGVPIATDTAFAVALIVLLGERVPVALRVFLTAAVIVDDLVVTAIVALFYSGEIDGLFLAASVAVFAGLVGLNRAGIYRALPYGLLGLILWLCLHEAGLHATLAGVLLALVTPTRPPANLPALLAQAEMVIRTEASGSRDAVIQHGLSEPALRALDSIHDRIDSPANKLLRSVQPWSSYLVLPLFALANAGVAWSPAILDGNGRLMLAIAAGLVLGKPLGIVTAAWLAVRLGLADKPEQYSWRQLAGAGALAGIGFTMSLFIAGQAFPDETTFAAAKVAIFLASLIAGSLGAAVLWRRR